MLQLLPCLLLVLIHSRLLFSAVCESVWSSGKALGWYLSSIRFGSPLSSCGLWTLSNCDFVVPQLMKRYSDLHRWQS